MISRFIVLALPLAVALCSAPREAHAQTEEDLARAVELKKEGDELVHSLHFREALLSYDRAFEISHDPAILYNRARALDALGETPQSLDAFEAFLRVAPPSLKAKVPKLDELVASVRARVATLVIRCPVTGANVVVRRRLEGTTPLATPLRVPTGAASIEIQAPGYQPYRVELELGGGAPTTLDVALVPSVETAAPPAAVPSAAPSETGSPERGSRGGDGWKVAAYSAGGVGLAGVASGAILGVLALTKRDSADADCPGGTCNPAGSATIADARTFAIASTTSFVVGGVALATSVVLFLWKPGAPGVHGRLMPVLGPTFGGIVGSF